MYEKQYFPYVINYECRDLPHVKRKNLLWKHDSVYLFQIFEKLAKAIFEWNYNKFSRSILLIKNTLRYLCFDVNLWWKEKKHWNIKKSNEYLNNGLENSKTLFTNFSISIFQNIHKKLGKHLIPQGKFVLIYFCTEDWKKYFNEIRCTIFKWISEMSAFFFWL